MVININIVTYKLNLQDITLKNPILLKINIARGKKQKIY